MRHVRRSSTRAIVAGIALVLAILVSLGLSIWVAREQAIDEWRKQLANLSLILAEQTSQELTSAVLVLNSIVDSVAAADAHNAEQLRARLDKRAVHDSLRDKTRALPQVDVATVVDASGQVVVFTRAYPAPPIKLADRDYFLQHLSSLDVGVFISEPVRNRGNGRWTFYLSRRLVGADGQFLGVALVGLSSAFFTDFYGKISLGEAAAISLARRDFTVLAHWPPIDGQVGARERSGASYRVIEQQHQSHGVVMSAAEGAAAARMSAPRLVGSYPLIVNVSISEAQYLAHWRQFAAYLSLVAGASAAAIAIAFLLLAKSLRRRERDIELAERLKGEAEAASRAKSEFLAMMSHEIRTPLTSIIGFAEMLGNSSADAGERAEAGAIILRNGRHLLTIINDILDISKIEAGRLQIERVAFSPLEVIAGIDAMMGTQATSKGIAFGAVCEYPLPDKVMGDPTRWKQILFNLCSNAIKFTELGTVQLTLWYDRDAERLLCNVVDTGIGISEEQIALLFKPFTQADSAISRRFGGSGLGLHLVQKLAERMDGKVSVVSQLGRGSVFEVGVAAPPAPGALWLEQAPLALPDAAPAPAVAALRGRVLLAEDGPDNRKLVTAFFRRLGLDYAVAENGAEAVEQALAGDFDVVLMDMQMPVMDGASATGVLRGAGYAGPIVALTANVMAEDVQQYLAIGCSHCVGKPIDFKQLAELLASLLAQHAQDVRAQLSVEQIEEFDAIRRSFSDSLPERLALLKRAVEQRDWDELARLAHLLKGSAGSFGYGGVTDGARELERAAARGDMAQALAIVRQMGASIAAVNGATMVAGEKEDGSEG